MKFDEIIKLIDAGYTKEEIKAFEAQQDAPLEEQPEEVQRPAPEAPAEVSKIDEAIAKLEKLSEGMAKIAILNSQQPPQPDTEDFLASIINPTYHKEE